ncbi:helix-turn-helix transcriptional regulator [Streptomyces sp. NPDC017529]|uniref:helix-turn-helix transcriptional regulator n=1 Tax=Streptomyces sp. NPDC017529 TaxID=3365000 RepID=UPI0037B5A3FE
MPETDFRYLLAGFRAGRGRHMNKPGARWSFLSNHTRVLLVLAREPTSRIRDIAAACHVTERTAQTIVADLEEAGYLSRERHGRRTHYTLRLDGRLRHPTEAHLPVRALLGLLADRSYGALPGRRPQPGSLSAGSAHGDEVEGTVGGGTD